MVMSTGRAGLSVRTAALSLAERARGLIGDLAVRGGDRAARLVEGRGDGFGFRQMPRLRLLAGAVGDEALDDAVLERMEGDDGEPAARLQRPLGGKQRTGELAELIIDEDAQRLEDAGGRVDLVLRIAADMRLDGIGKVERALERALLAPPLDHPRDAARMPLLAEEAEDAREIARLEAVDHVGSRRAGLGHAHVERPVGAEGEAAIGLVELHRRDADVEHDAVDLSLGKFVEPRKRSMHQLQPAGKCRSEIRAGLDRVGITIDRDDVGAGGKQRSRVAARAKGAVDDRLAGAGFERGRDLVEKDRSVVGRSANSVVFRAMARHHSVSPAIRRCVAACRSLTSLERASAP